jgi:hypothetical protein
LLADGLRRLSPHQAVILFSALPSVASCFGKEVFRLGSQICRLLRTGNNEMPPFTLQIDPP